MSVFDWILFAVEALTLFSCGWLIYLIGKRRGFDEAAQITLGAGWDKRFPA